MCPNSHTAEKKPTRGGHALWRVVTFVVVVLLVAGSWHLWAWTTYRRSFDTRATLADRTSAAQLASTLEPWNATFSTRALVMEKWQHGAIYFSQGAYRPAMLELADAYRLDVGDKELLALFQESQVRLSVSSNYKAHVQHAHEGPGGTLRPQDLLP
jgi:hypothetical protein